MLLTETQTEKSDQTSKDIIEILKAYPVRIPRLQEKDEKNIRKPHYTQRNDKKV
jgi:hypothetical protein